MRNDVHIRINGSGTPDDPFWRSGHYKKPSTRDERKRLFAEAAIRMGYLAPAMKALRDAGYCVGLPGLAQPDPISATR